MLPVLSIVQPVFGLILIGGIVGMAKLYGREVASTSGTVPLSTSGSFTTLSALLA